MRADVIASLRCEWSGEEPHHGVEEVDTPCWDYAKEMVNGKLYCEEHAHEMRELLGMEKRNGRKS
jgi:hypothetical protein